MNAQEVVIEEPDQKAEMPPLRLNQRRVLSFAIALGHPTRIDILLALHNDGPASSVMLFRRRLETLGNVSYHMSRLKKAGAIEEVASRQVRGSTERVWDVSPFGQDVLKVADVIGRTAVNAA
jgi:DNA-binding transcriptional ArsR family regulator